MVKILWTLLFVSGWESPGIGAEIWTRITSHGLEGLSLQPTMWTGKKIYDLIAETQQISQRAIAGKLNVGLASVSEIIAGLG